MVQAYLSRLRAAVDPPGLLITPDLSGVAVMDFHKGATAMARGAKAVREAETRIRALVG